MHHTIPPGLRFAIIDRAFKRKMDEKASALGLTSVQLRVLGEISMMEARGVTEINQKNLEEAEKVTHPTMTAIIKQLEKKGFVQCAVSETDRRYKKISCSPHVKNIHMDIAVQDEAVLYEICKDMSMEEIDSLIQLTNKILQNIS